MVPLGFCQRITGKISKITKKKVLSGEKIYTPLCVIRLIPEGTAYYEIILAPGASKKEGRYSLDKPTIIEQGIKLVFFAFPASKENRGESLTVGKKYQFYTAGGRNWVSIWQEIGK